MVRTRSMYSINQECVWYEPGACTVRTRSVYGTNKDDDNTNQENVLTRDTY